MTHPDPEKNKAQAEYLDNCDPEYRRFNELMFMIGNATYRYHQIAKKFQPSEEDWREWIDGLPEPVKTEMLNKGFIQCQGILSFTRYVNEKNDLGLEEFLKKNINPKDFQEWKELLNDKNTDDKQ